MSDTIYAKSLLKGDFHRSKLPNCFPEIDFTDDNCIVVYAGFVNQNILKMDLNDILLFRKRLLIGHNPDRKYYFDCVLEGIVVPVISTIHKIVEDYIDPKNVYFFTGSLNGKELYDEYVIKNNIKNPFNILTSSSWEGHLNYLGPSYSYQIKNKEKLFLCFNRVTRPHRTAFLSLLEEKGLRERAYYSYLNCTHGSSNLNADIVIQDANKWVTSETGKIIEKNYKKLEPIIPLKLNIDPHINMTTFIKSDLRYFENSYFSFVTETMFFPVFSSTVENSIFFSEKIFKPIAIKHPFILACTAHSLEYLRKENYKTFHPFIDETYDIIENDELRMLAIVNEIERLSKQSDEQWIEWQENIKDIVDYNYRIFHIKNKEKWKKNINLEGI